MAKYKIRTVKRPAEVIEVEGPELFDLTRQGLVLEVVDEDAPPSPPAPTRRSVTRKAETAEPVDEKEESGP